MIQMGNLLSKNTESVIKELPRPKLMLWPMCNKIVCGRQLTESPRCPWHPVRKDLPSVATHICQERKQDGYSSPGKAEGQWQGRKSVNAMNRPFKNYSSFLCQKVNRSSMSINEMSFLLFG